MLDEAPVGGTESTSNRDRVSGLPPPLALFEAARAVARRPRRDKWWAVAVLAVVVAAGIGLALLVDFQAVQPSLVPASLQVSIVADRASGEHPVLVNFSTLVSGGVPSYQYV